MPRQTLYKPPNPQVEPWPPEWPTDHLYSDEPAKDVFSRSCLAIAEALEQHGYRYRKSQNRCTRSDGSFEYEIRFQSSHYNAYGRHFQIWMHAKVSSKELLQWRGSRLQPEHCTDYVAGGMVHLLGTRFALVQWELADPTDRSATISDAIAFLRSEVEPYFDLFREPATLIPSLAHSFVPAFDLLGSVEYSYCFGGKSQAQQVLDFFVSRKRALLPDLGRLPPTESNAVRHGDYSRQVAFLQHTYGFA